MYCSLAKYNTTTKSVDWLPFILQGRQTIEITDKVRNCLTDLNVEQIKTIPNLAKLIDSYEMGEPKVLDFAQGIRDGSIQLKDGQTMLQGYQLYLKSTSKSLDFANLKTKALSASMKVLSTIGWMAIAWAASQVISGLSQLAHTSDNVAKKAQEVGDSFSSTKKSIEDYKTQVDALQKTIHDSSPSISEVSEARKSLMSIQDELIDKYGNEEGAIYNITSAINGETEAWKNLTAIQWQSSKNEFNDNGFWEDLGNNIDGYRDNIDRMLDEYGNYSQTIGVGSITGLEERAEAEKLLSQFGTLERLSDGGLGYITLSGNASEVYNQILEVQALINETDADFGRNFARELTEMANAAKNVSNQYKKMYNQYVLNEEIFGDMDYSNSFNGIISQYEQLQNILNSNDADKIKAEQDAFAKTVVESMNQAFERGDNGVADYFRNMYPELQEVVSEWEFSADFKLNTDGIVGQTMDASSKFNSSEEILNFNANTATQEQVDAYSTLRNVAEKYKTSLEHIVSLLEEEGILQSENRRQLEDKFGKTTVSSLSDEDLKIAYEVSDGTIQSWDELIAKIEEYKASLKEDVKTPIFAYDKLGDIPSKLSEIEAAYKTAADALEEYNKTGTYSMSTIDSILSLSNDYINALVDENGQVQINEESISRLAAIKIEAAKASVYQEACEELVRLKTLDTSIAAQELALTNGTLTESAYNVAKALYEEVVAMGGANAVLAGNVWDTATKKVKVLDNQLKNLNNGSYNVGKSKVADSIEKAAKDYTKILDAELNLLDAKMKAGLLDFKSYLSQRKNLIEDYYNSGKIKANEYYSYLQKHYETELSSMNQVLSAVDRRLEKEIDSYQDQITSIEERYQTEIDYLDTVIQYYEDQKTALQDANDEIDRQLKLEQALYAFEMAQNQRTKKVYTSDSGFVYKADGTAIKDASDDLRNAKLDIEIAKLEEAIKQVESQQKALQDAMEAETAALEDIISNLEAYRDKWNEIAKEYEITQNDMLATQLLGADWESQIINGRMETLNKFRDDYLAVQQSIVDAAWKSANEQIEAAKQAELKSQGQKGSGVIQTTSTVSTTPANPAYWVYQSLGSYDTKGEASSKIGMLNGDEIINVGGKYLVVKWKNGYKSSGEASSKISSNHGNGVYKRYHTGLKEGLVGKSSFDDDFSVVQKFGLKEYEVPAILKKNEAVLTEVQLGNLADVLRFIPTNNIVPNVHVPDYSSLMSPATKNTEQSVVQNINVTLPNITNEAGFNNFKREMDRLRLDAYQYAHRRHR